MKVDHVAAMKVDQVATIKVGLAATMKMVMWRRDHKSGPCGDHVIEKLGHCGCIRAEGMDHPGVADC